MNKQCKGCNAVKSLEMFYRHSRMGDGRLNYCVDCVKKRIARHRAANIDKIRQYDKQRSQTPERREQLRTLAEKYISDPLRKAATVATSNAIRSGKLLRPTACSECGCKCKPDAHHDDYAKPLVVRWLCRPCHARHHRLECLREGFL